MKHGERYGLHASRSYLDPRHPHRLLREDGVPEQARRQLNSMPPMVWALVGESDTGRWSILFITSCVSLGLCSSCLRGVAPLHDHEWQSKCLPPIEIHLEMRFPTQSRARRNGGAVPSASSADQILPPSAGAMVARSPAVSITIVARLPGTGGF